MGKVKEEPMKFLRCGCQHKYQDAKFGPGMRAMNPTVNIAKHGGTHRCTVCGRVRSV